MKNKILTFITIFILLLTIGCNKQESNKEIQKETDNFELKEEKGKVLISIDKTRTIALYHDNKVVTKYELYTDYGTIEKAKEEYNTYIELKTYEGMEEVLNFTRKGKYLLIEYDESRFPVKNYEDIKKLEEMYKNRNEKK